MRSINVQRRSRALRTRRRIQTRVDTGRHRLSVFRSSRYIYAQVIDDNTGTTVVQGNSRNGATGANNIDRAFEVGKALAEQAKEGSYLFIPTEPSREINIGGDNFVSILGPLLSKRLKWAPECFMALK